MFESGAIYMLILTVLGLLADAISVPIGPNGTIGSSLPILVAEALIPKPLTESEFTWSRFLAYSSFTFIVYLPEQSVRFPD